MSQLCLLTLSLFFVLGNSKHAEEEKYDYVLETKDEGVIMDTKPMAFLRKSNKTLGTGFVLGTASYKFYTDPSFKIRATAADRYYYFYRDQSKYFIRDENCNFVCLNPCGEILVAPYRLQHYCKYHIEEGDHGLHKIYIASSGATPMYRSLDFDVPGNILRGKLNIKSKDDVSALFTLKKAVKFQKSCPRISMVEQYNLDARPDPSKPDTRCAKLDVIRPINPSKVSVSLPIREEVLLHYNLKIEDRFVSETGDLSGSEGYNTVFTKVYVKPNQFTFVNAQTCKHLCQNKCGRVYMSEMFNSDCKVRVEVTEEKDASYMRFLGNNFYLAYNSTTEALYFSAGARNAITFENAFFPKFKCRVNTNRVGLADDKCVHNSVSHKLVASIPPIFLLLILNYNNTRITIE
jgi:hypothetical protein